MVEEVNKCEEDILYFAKTYCWINDPNTFKEFKFQLWDFQEEILSSFQDHRKQVILKARQIGISWLVCVYSLHTALFKNNANILVLSQGEQEAQRLLERIKFINDRLPSWLTQPIASENLTLLSFRSPKSGFQSRIKALPSTPKAGRSETASIVICDEWAFHPYAQANYAALEPTLGQHGQFIGVSTADGLGNFYHQTWLQAERGINDFHPTFLDYSKHPDRRDPDWWDKAYAAYTGDKKLFLQEYPRNPMEAFISSGGCIFDLDGLQWLADEVCTEPLDIKQIVERSAKLAELSHKGHIRVWHTPVRGQQYVIGADPASGHGEDYSAAQIINRNTGEHCATIMVKMEPEEFAGLLVEVGHEYNTAFVVVERNNHGHAVISHLQNVLNYGNIYRYEKDRRTKMGDNREGFPVNKSTKPLIYGGLQSDISNRAVLIYDMNFVHQAQTFVERKNGSIGAEAGMNDDLVSAWVMARVGRFAPNKARSRQVRRVRSNKQFRRRHR